ncbi:hypothetical protein [Acinetobacter sp. MD2]|uniref:hypothetical protein n=1 Tax=Acinetobacter sp. MD2 TaxID=2600066 RepID=UPI002D1F09C5|nr:hypothetical protein [Acinetobacter sp. MD2]MEB3766390.1 hypothetical protein [Acinetobacter sp. MD2]
MEKLIVKGGFRERANRYKKYQHSENQQTSLQQHGYAQTSKNATATTESVNTATKPQT